MYLKLAAWGKIEGAGFDLLEEPPVVAKHVDVERPIFEAAGFNDTDELGTERSLALLGEGVASDVVAAEFGIQPVDQAGADATFISA